MTNQYVQMHEVSREKDSAGAPQYEAIVYFGWDWKRRQYGCYWMDITGGGAFSEEGIGRAEPKGNEIPFLFKAGGGTAFHTTFVYDPANHAWKWSMDGEANGTLQPSARVTSRRVK